MSKAGWTLEDIDWDRFDPSLVDADLLKVVKAASLVEHNAAEYVVYLKRVYADRPDVHPVIEQWGREEIQHGQALGRWAEMADPAFNFEAARKAFHDGYRPEHFDHGEGSVRGSRAGEMVSRCVVESFTTSFYSAMRDAAREPVLKQITGNIAGDEMRHWRLFYDMKNAEAVRPGLFQALRIAASRVGESEDDELAYAFYCGNTPAERIGVDPYNRRAGQYGYESRVNRLFKRAHLDRAMGMIAVAIGRPARGLLARTASAAMSAVLWLKTRSAPPKAAV